MLLSLQIKYSEARDRNFLDYIKSCGFDGVELILDGDLSDAREVSEGIKSSGLAVCQTQIDIANVGEGLRASALLGVKWACLSAIVNYDSDVVTNAIPLAEKYGVGIALENPATHDDVADTFCIWADSFKSEYVGICYNVGRANLAGCDDFGIKKFDVDKADAVRRTGERIKTVHISDNHGDVDRRLCPTVANAVCSVEWNKMISALKDTGFDGAFSLNCDLDFGEYDLKRDYIRFIANVCNILLGKEVAE